MNKILFSLSILTAFFANAQTTNDFESFTLSAESYNNGNDFNGGFTESSIFLPNSYDTVGGYETWGGFAISNMIDITTAGYGNQYSVSSGSGYNSSSNFAVFYQGYGSPNTLKLNNTTDVGFESMYVNNNTYAYLSMKNGDAYAKKFGGASGNDPDFFLLTIKKYKNGTLGADSVNFYLADFRFADNNQDYIINEWTRVDLTPLGEADSLQFTLSSSDVGQFGINTPTYFCADNIKTTNNITSIASLNTINANIYPNPTTDFIKIETPNLSGNLNIVNMLGNQVYATKHQEFSRINVESLAKGTYFISITDKENNSYSSSFIKK
ncbi:MAG: DUF4465 domain-containing protein [Bacteroidetes bacterium]|nr:DUF4465 domain-containing protein [Bacteroidota bacterium]